MSGALARASDPAPSHIAAAKCDAPSLEDLVLAILKRGPATIHDVAEVTGSVWCPSRPASRSCAARAVWLTRACAIRRAACLARFGGSHEDRRIRSPGIRHRLRLGKFSGLPKEQEDAPMKLCDYLWFAGFLLLLLIPIALRVHR